MAFRENLRDELEYNGYQLKEFAAKIGISYGSFLSYVDARATLPNVEIACKMAKELNCSVEYLVTGKDMLNTQQKHKKLLENLTQLPTEIQETICFMVQSMANESKKIK